MQALLGQALQPHFRQPPGYGRHIAEEKPLPVRQAPAAGVILYPPIAVLFCPTALPDDAGCDTTAADSTTGAGSKRLKT